ncbi:MAG: nitrogen metabolism signal transduction histidine kinase NtrY [Steroidobacteraceae bacterium]|jgi:nitrogen fixation/metabolism regulation signal transduction histidine kinase|nr:nitrogen metabolism signal transduction histidine kinase NtrY [Steroidobacteraceae bacterium]
MVPAALRRLGTLGLIALWVLVSGGLLLLLALSVQNSVQFSELQSWILLANVVALIGVGYLLTRKIIELVRAFRAQVPGSRLTARTVAIFGSLVVAPLIIVYLFSLEFLNRGIDSWFKVEIKQGLTDALELSKSAVDVRMREYARSTQLFANRLADSPPSTWAIASDQQRVESGALQVVVYGRLGQVLASSSVGASSSLPRASAEVTAAIDAGNTYWSLEPLSEDDYLINTAAPIAISPGSSEGRFVVAMYPVPPHLVRLSEAVQHSYSQHSNLTSQREGVKNLFGMTLTLVLLLAMLTAIYGAIYSAEKLTRPVQDLIAGTRAVGKGDFGTRLPLPSRDEMGFLVHSFNDMTKRLRRAREETQRSQVAVERERERLSIILARLSTGVISLGRDLTLRSANQAASNILGVELERGVGQPLGALSDENPRYARFVGEVTQRLAKGDEEWREQLDLKPEAAGARVLVCACTPLPGDDHAENELERQPGYVIVFDDISALLQAQRDAAWGEVARRLAHEIKNPLTPIQLSAERMRRRYLAQMQGEDAQILDRATYTIVQQVEAMKAMVNAFSEYARAPDMKVTKFPLNALVTEVVDLHRVQESGIRIDVDLDNHIDQVEADRGRVRQILNNLIVNGAEAAENVPDGRVVASTRLETLGNAAYVTITVTDNGPGFSREVLGRVFEPYVTSKPKGTGLGLAIVKKIVEEHGGRVEADNRPEGGGRVRVSLPVTDGTRQMVARERRAEPRKERA